MQRGKSLSLAESLKLEFRLMSHLIEGHDYGEGINARIAGKGREAEWEPATVEEADTGEIVRLFETPVPGELELEDLVPGGQDSLGSQDFSESNGLREKLNNH